MLIRTSSPAACRSAPLSPAAWRRSRACLLLDEPLGALDPLTRSYLQDELLRLWEHEGITVVMVTHDVEEAVFLSDRIVVMDPRPGRVRRIFDIPAERPRRRAAPDFVAVKEEILGLLLRGRAPAG